MADDITKDVLLEYIKEMKKDLEKKIGDISMELGGMNGAIASMNVEIVSMNGAIANMNVEIGSTKGKLGSLQSSIDGLDRKILQLGTKMDQGFEDARRHREALQEDLEETMRVQGIHGTKLARL